MTTGAIDMSMGELEDKVRAVVMAYEKGKSMDKEMSVLKQAVNVDGMQELLCEEMMTSITPSDNGYLKRKCVPLERGIESRAPDKRPEFKIYIWSEDTYLIYTYIELNALIIDSVEGLKEYIAGSEPADPEYRNERDALKAKLRDLALIANTAIAAIDEQSESMEHDNQ